MAYAVTKKGAKFFLENENTGRVIGNYDTVEKAEAAKKGLERKHDSDIRHHGLDKATVSIHKED